MTTEAHEWTTADVPDLTGRRALVTGVTSGLGEALVEELARHGAEVLLAARNPAKLAATVERVRERRARRGGAPGAARPREPGVGAARGGRRGVVRTAAPAGQQRRRDGDAVPAHRRRLRAAAGHQRARALRADRAAVAAAGGRRRRPGRQRLLGGAPDGAARAARRPAPPAAAVPALAGVLRPPSSRTCYVTFELERRAREAGLPVHAWPPTRASPRPGWSPRAAGPRRSPASWTRPTRWSRSRPPPVRRRC